MKYARFTAGGRMLNGHLHDGKLIDAAGVAHDPDQVQFRLPVDPPKVIALALNFNDHAGELGLTQPKEPALFWKPNTTLLPHRGTVIYPRGAKFMHYEVELGVVIGRDARRRDAQLPSPRCVDGQARHLRPAPARDAEGQPRGRDRPDRDALPVPRAGPARPDRRAASRIRASARSATQREPSTRASTSSGVNISGGSRKPGFST